ncbi:Protein NLRC3 [Stylophora pistillata]|uniref:Protein NLRC3 n=1 Tax=Stylophora pistillata TaxID=50429 RepID=A0A2B4SBP4_STYPI|nr:Protein NLRC3 [Stylophora pistillata]
MDTLKESLAPKTFNKISHLAVLVWFVIGAIFLGIFTEVENTESRFDFRCGGAETENTDLVRGDCFQQYEEQYNKYGVPIYGFVTINFFLIALVCAIFSQIVRKTVDELSPSTRNGDRESQSRHREKQKSTGKQLFIAYCCQLSTRLVLGVLFMILQTQLLYPLRFPYKFDCYLTSGTNQPRNLSDAAQNSTQFHKCNNQRAEKKTFWMYAVLAVNGIYVAGILIETIYILSRARVETKFMKNSEFLKIHLNPNHDKSYQEPQKQEGRIQVVVMQPRVHDNLPTQPGLHPEPQRQDDVAQSQPREREHRPIQVEIHVHPQKQDDVIPPHPREQEHRPTKMESYQEPQRQNDVVPLPPRDQIGSHQEPQQPEGRSEHDIISPVQREPEQLQNSNLQLFIAETKKIIKENTQHLFELQPPFLGNPGEQTAVKYFTLDQIYTNLVVVPNRATYDFTANREEQLKVYPRPRTESQLKSLEDLLNDKSKKVLIVGRPGIGKTFCCTKLLRNWACKEVSEIHFDPAFLIKFRRFNSDNHLSLRELLVQSEHFPSDHLDDEVWKYILQHPESVLILFDGFDEFNHNANIIQWPASSPKSIEQKVPLQSLYYWLVTGKLLKNALILTTTRPTALSSIKRLPFDKTCEILGFTTEQIKEYVSRFCGDDKQAGERLWRHISSNMNLLSLCYIPVNSFIMCSSLFEILQFESSASATLPSELTTLYMIAVTVFYLKHTKEFRDNESTREHLDYNNLPPEVEEKFEKLGKVAFEGIKKGKLILGGNEVRGMEDSALFHRLPDCRSDALKREPQFCFIHLTMQEFFAARHLANNVSETELRNFVTKNSENGKWQLVIQFLAGLMNDKDELPSEIITDLLPVETEEEERYDDDEQTGNEEEWKVTCWPTKDKRDLAVTLCKCVNESKKMEIIVQRKLQQINFNCVNFIASHLTAVECSSLINVIKNIEQISHLDLMDNNMDSLGCLEIAKLLIYWKCRLSWLNLAENQLTDEAVKHLANAITNNNCQLRSLNLSENNITDTGAQHLAEAITNNNCQLRSLNLSENNITDTGAQHLAEAITNNKCQLHTLSLSFNYITVTGAQHLAEAITDSCQLRSLNLSKNNITDTGAQYLADAITKNNFQLRTLNLSQNNITDTGVQHLAHAITSNNCQLHTLNLSYNNITDTGAQHLADAITNNDCQLHTLDLLGNNITDTGAQHLADAITNNNCQLRSLNLSYNNMTKVGKRSGSLSFILTANEIVKY